MIATHRGRRVLSRIAARISFALTCLVLPPAASAQATYNLQNGSTRLTFATDPVTGLRLASVTDVPSGYTFFNTPPAGEGLWQVVYTPHSQFGAPQTSFGPSAPHVLTVNPSPTALHVIWDQIVFNPLNVNEPPARVEMFVSLGPTDTMARFWFGVARGVGQRLASLDEVRAPIMHLAGPISTRMDAFGNPENYYEAQWRARVFVPAHSASSFWSPNYPLAGWLVAGERFFDHPNQQAFQFTAVANMDPDDPGYRRMLYYGSEDATGYWKSFRYLGVVGPVGELVFRFSHVYKPPFVDMVAGGTQPNEWGNTFLPSYPVAIGPMLARSDHWWWTVLEHYRSWMESTGVMVGPKYETNPDIGRFKHPAVVSVQYKQLPPFTSILPRAVNLAEAYQLRLSDPFVPNAQHYLWVGNYNMAGTYGHPSNPPNQDLDPNLPATVAQANTLGILIGGYTEGLGVPNVSQWSIPTGAQLYLRNGQPSGGATGQHTDFGTPLGQTWFSGPNGLGNEVINATLFHGLYVDGVSGQGFRAGYQQPGISLVHTAHGGNYCSQGKRIFFQVVRNMLRAKSWIGPGSDRAFVFSEVAEEYIAGKLDLVMQGYDYVPAHLSLFEDTFLVAQLPHIVRVPQAARTWWIPLWNAVYHEYQPANTPIMGLTTTGLATGPRYTGTAMGLTPGEWRDELCFAYGAFYTFGSKPTILPYNHDFDHSPISAVGGQLGPYDLLHDPTRSVDDAFTFVKLLHSSLQQAYAGQFVLFGRMEHPLLDVQAARVVNPTNAAWNKTDLVPAAFPWLEPPGAWWAQLAHAFPHDVPTVLDSTWQYPGVGFGVLLVNWTSVPRDFAGTFDPALYGLATPYAVDEITYGGASVRQLTTNQVGAYRIDYGTSSTQGLPQLPPRSATVLWIR